MNESLLSEYAPRAMQLPGNFETSVAATSHTEIDARGLPVSSIGGSVVIHDP
jgi:hypothetical protein